MEAKTREIFNLAHWLAANEKLDDHQFLPVWQTASGFVGAGDCPRARDRHSDASRATARQARCEADGLLGFVVERRGNLLLLHQLGRWERTTSDRKSGHFVDRCLDVLGDYIVAPRTVIDRKILESRSRTSLLANRC
jgi:hypothetical protein